MTEPYKVFVPMDVPEEATVKQREDLTLADDRPFVYANMGAPYGIVRILYPPSGEGLEGETLTYNNLIHIIRTYKVVPVQMGMCFMFISWAEAAGDDKKIPVLFGKTLLAKHLRDNYDITLTLNEEDKDGEDN